MEETDHGTIPLRLVEILRGCNSEDLAVRPNMDQGVRTLEDLEQYIDYPDLANTQIEEISFDNAWKMLYTTQPPSDRNDNTTAASEAIPSYRRFT